jgi:hypothetical protein
MEIKGVGMDDEKNPENLYDETCFDVRVAVIPAGKLTTEEGVEIEYSRRIKIQQGRFSLKMTALQALGLLTLLDNKEFKNTIREWALEEKDVRENEMLKLNI